MTLRFLYHLKKTQFKFSINPLKIYLVELREGTKLNGFLVRLNSFETIGFSPWTFITLPLIFEMLEMYKKQFEIRWSDVDANSHLANSAYTNFMSHTRMAFFAEYGFSMLDIKTYNLGPVVFYEHMFYFKESFLGAPITVTIEVSGLSEDGMLFMFEHNFYNHKGEHLAYCEMQGAWIDLKARKLSVLPESLLELAQKFPKSESFKVLTKADTRKHGVKPKAIEM